MAASSNLVLMAVAAFLAAAGCSRSGENRLTPGEQQAFENASPELKQNWERALEADRTNDYVGALTLFYGLLSPDLSAEQRQAVSKQMTALNTRLYDLARRGDPAAQKAIEELRRHPPNRQR